jgi:RNA polymerase sigma-70 factor (ECF subfamily)
MPYQQQFKELVETHGDKIYRLVSAYLTDKDELPDLYQEVLVNVWQSLPRFEGNSQLSTWVYRIAVNTAITFNKKELSRRQKLANPLAENHLALPEAANHSKEPQLQLLERCIAQLPEDERLVIGLLLDDQSYKNISEIIGISLSNVGVKINRAKAKLSRLMEEQAWTLNN